MGMLSVASEIKSVNKFPQEASTTERLTECFSFCKHQIHTYNHMQTAVGVSLERHGAAVHLLRFFHVQQVKT
jgi:hypothetical protein